MEPLFLAAICGCNAGLYREALHEVYIPRIQRGDARFAANVLGARGTLLLVLSHFFENGRWGSLVETAVEEQSLTAEDQLFILTQAALYLTTSRGMGSPEARICHVRAEALCHSLNRPMHLYVTLIGQWRYSSIHDKLSTTMQIAKRVYSLAQEQHNSAMTIGACRALTSTLYHLGDFDIAQQYAMLGVEVWRSGGIQRQIDEVTAPAVACLFFEALSEWHFAEISSAKTTMAKAIALAKELNDMHGLAVALYFSGCFGHFEGNCAEVERCGSDLIELSTRHNFELWLPAGSVLRGWARSASGSLAEGIAWIENGLVEYRVTSSMLFLPYWLALKAEALHLAHCTSAALETIREAEALAEEREERWWSAELHRLRAVFLAAMGADETQIDASFCQAIRTAKRQKSVSLEKRAEATYAEYRRQKPSPLGGHRFQLPLW